MLNEWLMLPQHEITKENAAKGQCKGNENICADGKNENKAATTMNVSSNCFLQSSRRSNQKKREKKMCGYPISSSYRCICIRRIFFFFTRLFEESLFC